jgi:hypothetical protein
VGASTARLQHNEVDRNIATLQKTLHHPHERHARVNVGARPREVRTPTYKIPPVSPGSVKTCTTTLRHIAEEHNIVTLQKPLNTQYRQLTHVSVGAQHREVRKPTHKVQSKHICRAQVVSVAAFATPIIVYLMDAPCTRLPTYII